MNYLYDYMLGTMLEINCPKCLASNILEDRQVERDMECTTCGAIFLVEVEKESPPNEENTLNEESESFVKDTEYLDEENEVFADSVDLSQIIITTGPPPFEYEVIDTLIVLETLSKNFFQEAGPSLAFNGVKRKLRNRGFKKGATAIINCHFDYRISAGHGIFGVIHDLEIFAYGTMVKKI